MVGDTLQRLLFRNRLDLAAKEVLVLSVGRLGDSTVVARRKRMARLVNLD